MNRVRRKRVEKPTDWNWLKLLSRKELESIASSNMYVFKTTPWAHQLSSFLACMANPGFLCSLDLGTGKTKVAVDVCMNLYGSKLKVFVVALNSALGNWKDEIHKHSDAQATILAGRIDERIDLIKGDGFFIINYEGLMRLCSKTVTTVKTVACETPDGPRIISKKRNRWAVDKAMIQKLMMAKFDAIIFDESHMLKNHLSLTFRIAKILCRRIDTRIQLTGTPIDKNLLDLWSQYYIADFGSTFGTGIGQFRNAYFKDKGYFGPDWKVTKSGEKVIKSKMYTKSIRYTEDEVDELPPKTFRTICFDLTKQQRKVYDRLSKISGEENVQGIKVQGKTHAFRQICSGFILKTKKEFSSNPKMDAFIDLVDTIIGSHKILVFYEYITEAKLISKVLKRKKVKFCTLNGQTKNKHKEYRKFQENDKYRLMLAHPKTGGASLTITAATYCVFFSNGSSVIQRKQCIKRIHRAGQTKRCFFYDLVANRSIEAYMKKNLRKGIDAFDRIVDGNSFKNALIGRQ